MKKISYDTALKARALYAMGADHYKQASAFEGALAKLLNIDEGGGGTYCGHLSDAMVNGDDGFDAALAKQGFVVVKRAIKKRRRKQ